MVTHLTSIIQLCVSTEFSTFFSYLFLFEIPTSLLESSHFLFNLELGLWKSTLLDMGSGL